MVKGGYTLDSSKGGGQQTLESVKGVGPGVPDAGRYAYTDWHSFTQPRLGEVSANVFEFKFCGSETLFINQDFPKVLFLLHLEFITF